jgi:hypothetical protein
MKDDNKTKAVWTKEIQTSSSVFDQRSLMAGTGLLLKIMRQFASIYRIKRILSCKERTSRLDISLCR